MADTTISSSDPRKLYDRSEPPPLTSGGPPPKKSSDASAQPNDTGPTAYDVKDVAKYMPATPLTGTATGPKEETLDALKGQKAALDKKLALPADYPTRKLDEARRDDLARRILDKESQAKAIARDTECPAWAACQPTMRGSDPNAGGWTFLSATTDQSGLHGTVTGSEDGSVRVGAADGRASDGQLEGSGALVKGHTQATNSAGVTLSASGQVLGGGAHVGTKNADGSVGKNAGAGVALASGEVTIETKEGWSITGGASAGVSADYSEGVKERGDHKSMCVRVDAGPATVGACIPVPNAKSSAP